MKRLIIITVLMTVVSFEALMGQCISCDNTFDDGFCLLNPHNGDPVSGAADCISWETVYEVFIPDDIPPEWFLLPGCD